MTNLFDVQNIRTLKNKIHTKQRTTNLENKPTLTQKNKS